MGRSILSPFYKSGSNLGFDLYRRQLLRVPVNVEPFVSILYAMASRSVSTTMKAAVSVRASEGLRMVSGPQTLLKLLHEGAPTSDVRDAQQAFSLDLKDMAYLLQTSERTLRRRMSTLSLPPTLTYRFLRVMSIVKKAKDLCGGISEASNQWLRSPNTALKNCVPWDLLGTESGTELVERLIGRLENSVPS